MVLSVTVCIPVDQNTDLLVRTVASLLEQTYKHFDVVICARDPISPEFQRRLLARGISTQVQLRPGCSDIQILNEYLTLSEGEYIKFVVPGTILDKHCLEQYAITAEQYK